MPIQSRIVPSNCSFEVCDANDGLPYDSNSFDVVHMRFVQNGLISLAFLLDEVTRVLRPGGMLLYMESPMFHLVAPGRDSETTTIPTLAHGIQELREAFSWVVKSREGIEVEIEGKGGFVKQVHRTRGLRVQGGGEIKVPLGSWRLGEFRSDIRYIRIAESNCHIEIQLCRATPQDSGQAGSREHGLACRVCTGIAG